MPMPMQIQNKHLIVVLAHNNYECLSEMIANINHFCPKADVAVYNSGHDEQLTKNLPVLNILPSRKLDYARIAPFFFDVFKWLEVNNFPYDYITNLDSDVLFIKHNYESFIQQQMLSCDYLAQDLLKNIHNRPRWRPIRSLRPELPAWYKFWGFEYAHGAFNPGQTFSKNYLQKLVQHKEYDELLELVRQNNSYTLHEVLFPTLVDFLGINAKSYPKDTNTANRYRPYQAISGVQRALSLKHAYFVHPVRRELNDPARTYIRNMQQNK